MIKDERDQEVRNIGNERNRGSWIKDQGCR